MELISAKLRQLHEDRSVVFFCGAGVSVPAGLPSFSDLTEQILRALRPSDPENLAWKAFNARNYDQALGILERYDGGGYGDEVREQAREILHAKINRRNLKLDAHVSLCRLTDLGNSRGRLVTTNFDPLFEKALARLSRTRKQKLKARIEVAPALSPPKKGSDWSGLVYLHGKLCETAEHSGLVLTTADFGKAYLLDGWARRFVIDLFRHFYVVFIGYSIDDPTMRYLVSALASARERREDFRECFVFAPYGGPNDPQTRKEASSAWEIKAVVPLPYENSDGTHENLWQGINKWSLDHAGGLESKLQTVIRYGGGRPTQSPGDSAEDLCWAVRDPDVAESLVSTEIGDSLEPAWIPTLQEEGLLSLSVEEGTSTPLVSYVITDGSVLHPVTRSLGRWAVSRLGSLDALHWVLGRGGVLHQDMRYFVRHSLRGGTNFGEGYRKIWRVLASDEYAHFLSAYYRPSILPPPVECSPGALRQILYRLKPIPIFRKLANIAGEPLGADDPRQLCRIDIELLGFKDASEIERFREELAGCDIDLSVLAEEITCLLGEALEWLREFGEASSEEDPTYPYVDAIAPREFMLSSPNWVHLVHLCRDSFTALFERDPASAERLARRWQSMNYPIFRRLALYVAAGSSDD